MGVLIGFVWNQVLINPFTNLTVALARALFGSYGLAIIVFTLLLRLVTLPLTIRQIQSSKKMSALQPRIQEIQKKYSDPKRRSEETMKLYKEEGVNPAGCVVPLLIQFPVLIALYEVIRITLGSTPESLIDLSHRLYPWPFVQHAIPLTSHFLWMDLGAPDPTFLMPLLVVASTWLSQRLTMTQQMQTNPQAAQTNQIMLLFMPLLFGWLSIKYPSGLALYWVLSNVITAVVNYFIFDWHGTPVTEILGLRDFSLSSLNPFSVGDPKRRQARRRPGPRPATEPAPAADGTTAPSRSAGSRAETAAAQAKRSTRKPKAPPVAPPATPVRARRTPGGSDNGAADTRSSDG